MAGAGSGTTPTGGRVGFKKTYSADSFDTAAVQALLALIKTTLTSAGFNLLVDRADAVDFIRMGSHAATAHDDIPHWAIGFVDGGSVGLLQAYAVYGPNFEDQSAKYSIRTFLNSGWLGYPPQDLTIHFACDGVEGWWWLNGTELNPNSVSGHEMRFAGAGITSRRFASDYHQGLATRYGVWNAWGDWYPAYGINNTGTILNGPWMTTWSPLGQGWAFNGKRHTGSPIPKMAVPLFPSRDGALSVSLFGEFNEVLALTDGYTHEEVPVPGWIAFTGNEWDPPYAVPAPVQFDVL